MPLVAGIDSSTQSCKVVIRDARTERARPAIPKAPRWIPSTGGVPCEPLWPTRADWPMLLL